MKTKLLAFVVILMTFSGCNKIKEATSITVNTKLQTNIPVLVTGTKSANGVNVATFSTSSEISLSDNSDLKAYLSKINEITLSNIAINVSGLGAGQTINSISLDVNGVGTVFSQSNITMTNNSFTPAVSAAMLNQMSSKLKADNKLTFTVSGNTSGPMTFVVNCNMDAKVIIFTI